MQDKMQSGGAGTPSGTGTPQIEEHALIGELTVTANGSTVTVTADELPVLIRQLREARGWSQTQLAEASGYSNAPRSLIADIEAGRRVLGLKTLSLLFEALGGEVRIGFFNPKIKTPMFAKIVQSYSADDFSEVQEESYPIEATRNRYNNLKSFADVEKLYGHRLDSACLIEVELYEGNVGDEDAELIDSKSFFFGEVKADEVLVIIPHQMPPSVETAVVDTPWYKVFAGYRLWDKHSYYRFDNKAEALAWAQSYEGHQWSKVRQLLSSED